MDMLVCVAHSGAHAGTSCFKIKNGGLVPDGKKLRPLSLGQTTPPVGPGTTVSQALFTDDNDALLVFVKGNAADNSTGYIMVYPVHGPFVSPAGKKNIQDGTITLFGSAQIPGTSRIVATDADVGGALIDIEKNNRVATKAIITVPGSKAECWAAYSSATGTVFITDGGVNSLIGINPWTGAVVSELIPDNGNTAMLDVRVAGDFAYGLAPGNPPHIAVFDVSQGNETIKYIENFVPAGLEGLEVPLNVEGMATWGQFS